MSFKLTPNEPYYHEWESLGGSLWCYGVYTGFIGWFFPSPTIFRSPSGLRVYREATHPRMHYETIERFVAMDRIFLMNYVKDYTNDEETLQYDPSATVYPKIGVSLNAPASAKMAGKQILVKYDVESYSPNEVQLFINSRYIRTDSIYPRTQRAFLLQPEYDNCHYGITLRPTKLDRGMYFYSIEVTEVG